jgi:dsDNA-specific endonuclease/ATPase MutS2
MSDADDDLEPIVVPIGPELDLHSFAPGDIPSVVEEYIAAAIAAGLTRVRIVHGRGRGVQRAVVHSILKQHAEVVSFYDDTASHLGATLAQLRERHNSQVRSER